MNQCSSTKEIVSKCVTLIYAADTPVTEDRHASTPASRGDRQGFSILARVADCDLVLRKVYEVLDLTPIKVARLIGVTSPTNAYHWINGRHRPSQAYVLRMCYLLCLQQEGINLKRIVPSTGTPTRSNGGTELSLMNVPLLMELLGGTFLFSASTYQLT